MCVDVGPFLALRFVSGRGARRGAFGNGRLGVTLI